MKKFLAIICAVSLLLTGCMSTEKDSKQTESSAQVLNLGMTFEQFKAAYNATIAKDFSETGWNLSETTLRSGEDKDTFRYNINDNVMLLGATEKNSAMMKEVMVVCIMQTQMRADLEKALVAYVTLMLTLSPELTVEQRGKLIEDLNLVGDKVDELINQNDGVAVRGNVRYRTTFDKDSGVLYFIASAKDLEYWNQRR